MNDCDSETHMDDSYLVMDEVEIEEESETEYEEDEKLMAQLDDVNSYSLEHQIVAD